MLLLEQLASACGVSGAEEEVRRIIMEDLQQEGIVGTVDALGNLLIDGFSVKAEDNHEAEQSELPRVLLAAHMDEVGLMITSVEDDGFIRFKTVGGIDERVLLSKTVLVGKQKIPGVIGSKAVHLQKPEERKKNVEVDQLYIDIGCSGKEEAQKKVKPGDYAAFNSPLQEAGEKIYKGKAMDDRVGCAILADLLKNREMPPFLSAFTVQEEAGLRGAQVAGYTMKPDFALILETTSASDVPGSEEHEQVSTLGGGPVLSIMDATVVVDSKMLEVLTGLARENGIPFQFRSFTGGGTDAGAISLSRRGVRSAVVSVPARYIHSPCSVVNKEDIYHTQKLVEYFLRVVEKKGFALFESWENPSSQGGASL